MGADATQTARLAAWRSRSGSRHQCARDRARSLHGVVGGELDLQAALAAIEEHAGMAERRLLDRDRHALLLPEWRDAADVVAGQPFGIRRAHHLRRLGGEGARKLFHADFAVGRHYGTDRLA